MGDRSGKVIIENINYTTGEPVESSFLKFN